MNRNPPTSVLIAALRLARGNCCQECGRKFRRLRYSRPNLDFAHYKPTGLSGKSRGSRLRYYDIKKNPTHYILLCKSCHNTLDMKLAKPAKKGNP